MYILFLKMYVFFLRMHMGFENDHRSERKPQIHSQCSKNEYFYPNKVVSIFIKDIHEL